MNYLHFFKAHSNSMQCGFWLHHVAEKMLLDFWWPTPLTFPLSSLSSLCKLSASFTRPLSPFSTCFSFRVWEGHYLTKSFHLFLFLSPLPTLESFSFTFYTLSPQTSLTCTTSITISVKPALWSPCLIPSSFLGVSLEFPVFCWTFSPICSTQCVRNTNYFFSSRSPISLICVAPNCPVHTQPTGQSSKKPNVVPSTCPSQKPSQLPRK